MTADNTADDSIDRPTPGAPSDNTDLSQVLDAWADTGFGGQFIGLEGARIECVTCGEVSPRRSIRRRGVATPRGGVGSR